LCSAFAAVRNKLGECAPLRVNLRHGARDQFFIREIYIIPYPQLVIALGSSRESSIHFPALIPLAKQRFECGSFLLGDGGTSTL